MRIASNQTVSFEHDINLDDNNMLLWGGNSIVKHTGSATEIGDNSSGSTLTLTGGNATFTGEITSGDDINTPTKLVVGESATAEVRIKKTNAGIGSVKFYNNDGSSSTSQAYLQLDASEDLVLYAAANNDVLFYAGGNLNLTMSSTTATFAGNVSHTGLTMTSGTDVDQVKEFTMSFQLVANTWTDTGIDGSDLATGTYAMQVYVDDHSVGGSHYDEYYSGMMSWFAGQTNETTHATDEIPVHRAGHAPNDGNVQFRTTRGSSADLKLQVKHNEAYSAALNNSNDKKMTFKFRRLI